MQWLSIVPTAAVVNKKHIDIVTRSASGEKELTHVLITNLTNAETRLFKHTVLGTFHLMDNTPNQHWITDDTPLEYEIGDGISEQEKVDLKLFLSNYRDCFAKDMTELGFTTWVELELNTGTAAPIRSTPWRVSHAQKEIIKEQIQEMLQHDIIEPSSSPWASPVVLVKKKDGGIRFCVDYRKLNAVTEGCSYPLPVIDDILSYLGNAQYFASLDMLSSYWQIAIKQSDRPKTAFVMSEGLFQFKKMPFGLKTAPSC